MRMKLHVFFAILFSFGVVHAIHAQELNAKITINHNQIQGTDVSVFQNLEHSPNL